MEFSKVINVKTGEGEKT